MRTRIFLSAAHYANVNRLLLYIRSLHAVESQGLRVESRKFWLTAFDLIPETDTLITVISNIRLFLDRPIAPNILFHRVARDDADPILGSFGIENRVGRRC